MPDISAQRFIELLGGDSPRPQEGLGNEIVSSANHISFGDINVTGQVIINDIVIERRVFIKGGSYNLIFGTAELTKWFHITGGSLTLLKINSLSCTDKSPDR